MNNQLQKYLGKIESAYFGIGGYQNTMIGLHLSFNFNGGGVCTNYSTWDPEIIKHSKFCKWSEEDRNNNFTEIIRKTSEILSAAKKHNVHSLPGTPIEITLKNNTFHDFRILTEVI